MTDEQINTAIAEACGWGYFKKTRTNRMLGKPISERGHLREVQDYCNDLNAMHEAEKVFTGEQWVKYVRLIGEATQEEKGRCHATARQRAEAFLKTTGKWKV